MNKQQLANKIWESANQMRSKIEANEYKDYILGFIFYKYLSDTEEKFLREHDFTEDDIPDVTEEDEETLEYVRTNIGYFIGYENLFSTWIKMGKDFDVSNVRDGLSAFSRLISPTHKRVFEGVFDTLQTGLSKLGDSSGSQTKAISQLIHLIRDIPMDGKQDYDVLGFIYEYLISMFAANAGKKAGEFYTPHEVSLLMSEIVANHLKYRKEIKIYDPTSGSGSLLINIGRSVAKHIDDADNIKYFAQELKQNTYNLTRMNLVMRGILPDNIVTRNGDTLEEDWPYFDENDPVGTYEPLYVDAVVSNPPYSQKWDSGNKDTDPRYSRFGLAPKSKADYAFLLHDLYHLKPDGIMTIVLPHGVLFRGGEEGEIRKNLIENNHIDTIIGLPANIFFGTGIPTIIMVLKQKRENTDVLIVDASKGFVKEGKNNKLQASDIKRIADVVNGRIDRDHYSRCVSREEIRNNDYNLNIPRYVDVAEKAETFDIYASMFGGIPARELEELEPYWTAFPDLKDKLFCKENDAYYSVAVTDMQKVLGQADSILKFKREYEKTFSDFAFELKRQIIEQMTTISIPKEEEKISRNIFARMEHIPLADPYEAYQILDDEWTKISVDLEMIQTEGFEATKKVDPNMVIKKRNGKDTEVQDGFVGHILPFELVQRELLTEDLNVLEGKRNRLSEIISIYDEILDSLSEEEKSEEIVNEAGDSFVAKAIVKQAKELKASGEHYEEDSLEAKIIHLNDLMNEEKALKQQIKKEEALLQEKTCQTIEGLSDNQVNTLLYVKWIQPLVDKILALPDHLFTELASKIDVLCKKYETTLASIEEELHETECILADMMNDLTGNEYDMRGLEELKALLWG